MTTREEFIAHWSGLASLPKSSIERTSDGVIIGGRKRLALPCNCGEDICLGWAMVAEEDAEDHLRFYGPDAADRT